MTRKKKPTTSIVRSSAAEYLTFVAASGTGGVEAIYADENVWLSQKMMVRAPGHAERPFRGKPITRSGPSRSPIPG